jgi:DNA-binding PadR family transcriptional regulator
MSIQYAILGFLSAESLTGYDIKKRFEESETLYWSGSNNQIYRTLVQLHQAALVTQAVEQPESGPARKVYTITDQGRAALKEWVLAAPDLPQLRHPFLVQLAWADQLDAGELDGLLDRYAEEAHVKLLMLREQAQRGAMFPARTPREAAIRDAVTGYWIAFYERELDWIRALRAELASM